MKKKKEKKKENEQKIDFTRNAYTHSTQFRGINIYMQRRKVGSDVEVSDVQVYSEGSDKKKVNNESFVVVVGGLLNSNKTQQKIIGILSLRLGVL